ncbi:MAG: hypothetical protein HeimC2_29990 [Candidatus Heimdallarchaeota archaeon LC_2]|nr:MAG: hypothetical protein HeimC2_29990 [Candidatus Heimdallarchaeota archaeon LC_2]
MKKLLIINLFLLIVAGMLTPTAADNRISSYSEPRRVQVDGISVVNGNTGTSNNIYLNEWRQSVNSLPDLSIYDYKITRSAFTAPTVVDFIQSATVFENSDLVVNAPPDPKKKKPINIDSSRDLRKFPGSGTETDPYIIEGFLFQNSRKNLIQIQFTDVYIVIRNNVLDGLNGGNVNILINSAQHITIEFNTLTSNNYGVMVSNSVDINVNSNSISNFVNDGVYLDNVNSLSVSSNKISQTTNGIVISNSFGGNVSYNTVFSNSGVGITLAYTDDVLLAGNKIYSNIQDGLFFLDSDLNTVINNNIYSNGLVGATALNSLNALSISSSGTLTINGFGGSGFFMDPSMDNLVLNNNITDNAGMGLYLQASHNTTIDGNNLNSNGLNGLFLEDSHDNVVNDNDITANGFSSGLSTLSLNFWQFISYSAFGGSGFFMDPSVGNVVSNNDISGNFGNGLALQHSTDTDIISNTVNNNGLSGMIFEDSDNNDILNNQITNNGDSGLRLATMSADTPFDMKLMSAFGGSGFFMDPSFNNVVDGNVLSGNTGSGLFLLDSENSVVSNNQIKSNGGDGVLVTNSSHNDFLSNVVSHNGVETPLLFSSFDLNENSLKLAGFGGSGFFMDPSVSNTLTDNFVTDNAGSGIYFLEIDESEISNNTISSNSFDGILFQNSNSNNITQNVIEYNGYDALASYSSLLSTDSFGGSGFFMDPSFFNVVTNNNFTNNAAYGFFSEASTNTEFSDNRLLDHPLYGVVLDGTSTDTFITGNNFQNNNVGGPQASDAGLDNVFATNFWADHDNNDTNFDGISDEPYLLDGATENTDFLASNIPNGLNFYNATMESSPRVLNAGSEGTPITLKVYLDDGFRALSIDLDNLWINGTINPYTSHIIDIQTFTVTFDRLAINDLVNALKRNPPFFVVFELTGRINDGLLEITAHDFVEINQVGKNTLLGLLPIAGTIGLIPILTHKKREEKDN